MNEYWNHPAVENMLNTVAEWDCGTGCTEEDMRGLIALGVRFPEIEDGTHDINEREDFIDQFAEPEKTYQITPTTSVFAGLPEDFTEEDFQAWLGI